MWDSGVKWPQDSSWTPTKESQAVCLVRAFWYSNPPAHMCNSHTNLQSREDRLCHLHFMTKEWRLAQGNVGPESHSESITKSQMEVWRKYYDSSASGDEDPWSLPCSQKSLGANPIEHTGVLYLPAPTWWASITFHVNGPLLVLQSQDQHKEGLAYGVTLKDTEHEHSLMSVMFLPKIHNLVLVGSNTRQKIPNL